MSLGVPPPPAWLELAARLLSAILDLVGPTFVRGKVDEWEAARAASNAAFAAKFPGEEPPP